MLLGVEKNRGKCLSYALINFSLVSLQILDFLDRDFQNYFLKGGLSKLVNKNKKSFERGRMTFTSVFKKGSMG